MPLTTGSAVAEVLLKDFAKLTADYDSIHISSYLTLASWHKKKKNDPNSQNSSDGQRKDDTIWDDINVRSKADISELDLPYGTNN